MTVRSHLLGSVLILSYRDRMTLRCHLPRKTVEVLTDCCSTILHFSNLGSPGQVYWTCSSCGQAPASDAVVFYDVAEWELTEEALQQRGFDVLSASLASGELRQAYLEGLAFYQRGKEAP